MILSRTQWIIFTEARTVVSFYIANLVKTPRTMLPTFQLLYNATLHLANDLFLFASIVAVLKSNLHFYINLKALFKQCDTGWGKINNPVKSD